MPYSVTAQILVVAGGGGGGGYYGGGGGGGGVASASISLILGTHSIVIGAGGSAGISSITGSSGNDSSFITAALPTATTYLAKGGGAGAGGTSGAYPALNGGSGGGGSLYTTYQTAGSSNQTSAGYSLGLGNAGGAGGNYPTISNGSGGGGGGAASTGQPGQPISSTIGNGGYGLYSSITGTSTPYGGGGGGGTWSSGYRAGTGGPGGGGNGALGAVTGIQNGIVNTGGGGGGDGANIGAGTGGSGIVIISYPAPQQFTGGTITTNSGNIIHTFTSLGSLSPITSYSSTLISQGDSVSTGVTRNSSLMSVSSISAYDTNPVDVYQTNTKTTMSTTLVTSNRSFAPQDAITAIIGITVIMADQTMMLMNNDPNQVATWDTAISNYQYVQLVTPANDPRYITVRVLYYVVGVTGTSPQTTGGLSTSYVQTWF
jgi:hypothetical protein